MEWLLTQDNKLSGPRVVRVRTRPLRLAYIVPHDAPDVAVRAIESCCLTWGGMTNILVPYVKERGITADWLRILDKSDPDNIVDAAGISERTAKRFQDRGQHIHRWDDPLKKPFVVGALQYSALLARDYPGSRGTSPTTILVTPQLPAADPLFYPALARYGQVNEGGVEETLRNHGLIPTTRYAQLVRVETVDLRESQRGAVLGEADLPIDPSRGVPGAGLRQILSVAASTLLGPLPVHGPSYTFGEPLAERPQFEEAYVAQVVVTGEANAVEDLCLFWNLRGERLWARGEPFPIWVPLPLLAKEEGKELIRIAAARWSAQGGRELGPGRSRGIHVVSASASKADISRALGSDIQISSIATRDLHRYFSGQCWVGWEEEKEAVFREGAARVPYEPPQFLRLFARYDRIVHEFCARGVNIPQTHSLSRRWLSMLRVSKDGLAGFYHASRPPQLAHMGLPDGWTLMEATFKDAGFEIATSDKGRLALGLIQLLGGLDGLAALASSQIYDILSRMSEITGRQAFQARLRELDTKREGVEELIRLVESGLAQEEQPRRHVGFGELRKALGQYVQPAVRWLIDRRLIFRGAQLQCSVCQLTKWYPIARLGEEFTCDGCQRTTPIPLDLASTQWNYRVNELYAKAHDQGVIPHLLTTYASWDPYTSESQPQTLGFHPGLVAKAPDDKVAKVSGFREMEIDFVELVGGKLIIGECRRDGGHFSDRDAERYASLGRALGCSRLVFSTLTDFSKSELVIALARRKFRGVVDTFTRRDLLDVRRGDRLEPEEYLGWIAGWLFSDAAVA